MKNKIANVILNIVKNPFDNMFTGALFSKFSSDKVAETKKIIAFEGQGTDSKDTLIFPKKNIKSFADIKEKDLDYILDAFKCVEELIKKGRENNKGYLLEVDSNHDHGLKQLHFHLVEEYA